MTLAIIDSGGANISSVKHALRRLGADPVFTADTDIIRSAERVILPGVGAAAAAMSRLRELDLVQCIRELQQHLRADRVSLLGAVHREEGDFALLLVDQIGHSVSNLCLRHRKS